MAAIQSLGEIAALQPPNWWATTSRSSVPFYDEYNYDYAELYRTQPNVRTCVDFLARNIAQLALHTFRRVGETDRERVRDHPFTKLWSQPLPPEMKVTSYRLVEGTVSDLGIYFNAYWLKVRKGGGPPGALLRIPPTFVTPKGGLFPSEYEITIAGRLLKVEPGNIVHFRGYNPESPVTGLSPLETLRRVLAEEYAAGQYREDFWRNSAKAEGFIKRPPDAPDWSDTARERFLAEFNQLYAGRGERSGGTAILEDGMEWIEGSFNPRESEFISGRKLTREECARSYHIPLPMVGILDNATFSNIREQHKNLYQDCLGPQLASIEADIQLQLIPDFPDTDDVYVEFNIADKLAGSFEEQMTAFQAAVGRPWMTANEARARQNLPAKAGGDELAIPLNIALGELPPEPPPAPPPAPPGAGGDDSEGAEDPPDPEARGRLPGGKRYNITHPTLRLKYREQWRKVLARHYRRQGDAMLSRVPKSLAGKAVVGGVWYDEDRWNGELSADLFGLNRLTALTWATHTQNQTGADLGDPEVFEARMLPWLAEHSRIQAEGINAQVRDELEVALANPDDPNGAVKHLFELAVTVWALEQAVTAVTAAANFGSTEAANAGGLRTKTWRVNSGNPRPSHAAMDGMTIGIRDLFPTGQRWPGDPAGGAEENSNCECSIEFG